MGAKKGSKRKEKPRFCGSCKMFLNEDIMGNGNCDTYNISKSCSDPACYKHIKLRNKGIKNK